MIAGPLFVAAFLIEGATRLGYDPLRLPISLLSVGEDGWMQIANFLVDGVLMLAFAVGLYRVLDERGTRSTLGPLLLGIFAIGVLCAGVFSTNPGGGYPPGTTARPEGSLPSTLHAIASLVVLSSLPVTCFVFARKFARGDEPGWATGSIVIGLILGIGFVVMFTGSSGTK